MLFNPINTMSSDFRVCICDVSSNEAVTALFALAADISLLSEDSVS